MKVKSFLAGIAVGAIVNGVVVALTTPKSGVELREDIRDKSDDTKKKVNDKFNVYKDSTDKKITEYKNAFKNKFDKSENIDSDEEINDLEKTLDEINGLDI